MAIVFTFIIVFLVVALLTRRPTPTPKHDPLCCPYCKLRATKATFTFDCENCGKTVLGELDLGAKPQY
jgi:hypothetical protein